jgi:bifunctional UDP-N-acetylglucosamine pyrophosphorylase/glucosamine-1-phosphate N-acetyltransferase
MRSARAKVLHQLCGRPLIRYVIDAVRYAGASRIVVVVGFGADQVRAELADEPDIAFVEQERQLGTGDAVRAAKNALGLSAGSAIVTAGDMPLLRPEPIAELVASRDRESAACVLGTSTIGDPTGFGRIVRDHSGQFSRIVEEKDCNNDERSIREINPSCYVFELPGLWDAIDRLETRNAQGEFYLTDVPAILISLGRRVLAQPILPPEDVIGVNSREQLAQAHSVLQARIAGRWMDHGVTIVDPRNTYIDPLAQIGEETVILPFTSISGSARIGRACRIGPFCHIRAGTVLGDFVELGAFVEISASEIGEATVARHLAYLGNATVGKAVNVGAGFITANFDGREKHQTTIGQNAMLGAGSIAIAPSTIGEAATLGAGAVVTSGREVKSGETVVGVPARPLRPSRSDKPAHGK